MVKRHILFFILILLTPFSTLAVTQVDALVDKNPVMQGEYFVLTVTADADLNSNALNTSTLKRDFIVGRTSVGHSTKIIDFDTSKTTSWQILLAPKTTGTFLIPSFTIAGASSTPIRLKVVSAGKQTTQNKHLFMTSEVSSKQAYVGQLILYKVKLYLGADLQRGVLNAPDIENAEVKQLGEDKDSQEILNGKRYRVIERTYGITPDKAGTLNIAPATFQGDIVMNNQSMRDSLFGFGFNNSRMVQTASKAIKLEVNPKPAHYQGQWLVADLVSLQDIWQEDQQYQVGSPITRTIVLMASNAEDSALADLNIPEPQGFKNYPEKAQRENIVRNGQLIAKLAQTIAMVPTKAGSYTLPEIKIPWWNPKLKKQQFAILPAKTIDVKAAATNTDIPQINQPISNNINTQPAVVTKTLIDAGYWPYVSVVFALLWIVTLMLWRRAASQHKNEAIVETKTVKLHAQQALTSACNSAMPGRVLMALQQYFSQCKGENVTLDKISALNPDMKKLIDELQYASYSRGGSDIDYSKIPTRVKACRIESKGQAQEPLAPLNP